MKFVFLSHLDLNLYLFRLPVMQALVKRGHEVIALCPRGEVFDHFADHGITAIHYAINRASLNPLRDALVIVQLARLLQRLKPDYVHTFTAKPNIYGTLAGRLAGVPTIYNLVEGLGSFYVDDSMRSRIIRTCMELLYGITSRLSQCTVFVNQDDPRYFWSRGLIAANKIHIIRSVGVDTEIFHPQAVDTQAVAVLRHSLGIGENQPVVLMVARAIWHKGLAEYIAAARIVRQEYPQAIFMLVGAVDAGNPSSATSEYLQAQKDILWLGPRQDISTLTALCTVYVLPSYREGVPRTLLEAAAMAKPIVTTDTVGCREVVENNINGFLVPVKNVPALAQGIATLLADPDLCLRMGQAGRDKAVREFDVHHVVRQYLSLYGVEE